MLKVPLNPSQSFNHVWRIPHYCSERCKLVYVCKL